jgi:6-phosphofructokinase 2
MTAPIVTFTPNPAIDVSTSVDQVVPTRKLRCAPQQRDPGGGGINVARVVKRLGGEVEAIYPSGGVTGQLLRQLVEREGIFGPPLQLAEETREDFTVTETSSGRQFRFVLPGPTLAEHEWRACLATLESFSPPPRFLVASGSLAPGCPVDLYAQVSRIAARWNAKMILDTSGPPLAAALAEGVHLVKPNLGELSELVGAPLSDGDMQIKVCRNLVATGRAKMVALTLGHRGALLVTDEEVWHADPLPVTPVSVVGAGDSFVGGMVFALACGWDLPDAFRHGMAAGSAAVLSSGTELAHAADVARLAAQVKLERIA